MTTDIPFEGASWAPEPDHDSRPGATSGTLQWPPGAVASVPNDGFIVDWQLPVASHS